MARYSLFLGLQVEVQYRAGDILLPASGTFVGDTGRSIFLEQKLEQKGQQRNFRWEIPYPCIVRLTQTEAASVQVKSVSPSLSAEIAQSFKASAESSANESDKGLADSLKASMLFPRPQRSNI